MSLYETITAKDIAEALAMNRPSIPTDENDSRIVEPWRQWVSDVCTIAHAIYDGEGARKEFYRVAKMPYRR